MAISKHTTYKVSFIIDRNVTPKERKELRELGYAVWVTGVSVQYPQYRITIPNLASRNEAEAAEDTTMKMLGI